MTKNRRKAVDNCIRLAFRIISYFSVAALAAMVIFVFYQGVVPFFSATAPYIMLVVENIDSVTVAGVAYQQRRTYIPVDYKDGDFTVEFVNRGQTVELTIRIRTGATDPDDILLFPSAIGDQLTNPELYSYTITYPGTIIGLEQKVHLNIPEPPQNPLAFLFGTEWRPVYRKLYGVFPMIVATLLTTLGGVLVGVPFALLSAVLIAEFMRQKTALLVTSAIELLAGIPSVVYGFFGLMIIVPLIQRLFGSASGSSLAAAIVVLSIMILPTVVAISVTSLKAVPDTYREASLALGATHMQTAWHVVFPAARSGIMASVILGTARAVGETMAVILVAGNSPQIPRALTDGVRTMTATVALEMGYSAGRHNQMLFSIGIVLFVFIFSLNGFFMRLMHRMEKKR